MDGFERFERFRFRPWVGYLVAAILVVGAWDRDADGWMIVRSIGLTLFFASQFIGQRRLRGSRGGASIVEWRAITFAAFSALLTLAFVIAMAIDAWRGQTR